MEEKFKLLTEDMAYVLYRERDNHPVVTQSAIPLAHSKENDDYGNMNEQSIPQAVKEGVYLYKKMANVSKGEEVRYKILGAVFDKQIQPELSGSENEIMRAVAHHMESDDEFPAMEEFIDWCVFSADADSMVELNLISEEVVKDVKAKIEGDEGL